MNCEPSTDKYSGASLLYGSLCSVSKTAEHYGITRQAMWKILKRRGCKMLPLRRSGTENHFYRGGPLAHKYSTQAVERAIKRGALIPKPCEVCGKYGMLKDGRRNVQAHHSDYNKPLLVNWLCRVHHVEWHENNTAVPWSRSKRRSRGKS
jgi:hypothetical protein